MIRDAMELLFLAANKEEFSENKYLWNLRKFEQDLTCLLYTSRCV